jgi:hypothetical protein
MVMQHADTARAPLGLHPLLALVGLVWGAGNVAAEATGSGLSLLSMLGPLLIGGAAVGTLILNICKERRERSALLRAARAEIEELRARLGQT